MNAALQALAHAPELCHALDAESHIRKCPVALRNERRRRKRQREMPPPNAAANARVGGGISDPTASANGWDGGNKAGQSPNSNSSSGAGGRNGTNNGSNKKKSHRRSNSSSSNGSNGSGKSSSKSKKKKIDGSANNMLWDPEYEYCTLCEVERLLGRVHSRPEEVIDNPQDESSSSTSSLDNKNDGNTTIKKEEGNPSSSIPHNTTATTAPVLPPQEGPVVPETFVSGFMSKVAPWFRRGVQEDSHEFLRLLIDAMQNSCKGARSNKNNKEDQQDDSEYPFQLFRGTVESNVKCSACRATSRKIDPIEDIGLDILPLKSNDNSAPPPLSSSRGSSSRSTSPTSNVALADVPQALERFISSEHLDSGYKCEKCGRLGKATKTSKLASIPPILTLHLKRFRYGAGGVKSSSRGGGTTINYNENGGGGSMSSTRSSRSARGSVQTDFDNVGPSGSAKIEGHVKFGHILDIKPYLTQELQSTVFQKAFARLFAVVVHSGKNSHSGHYVAYVKSLEKNEWWKMDDGRIARVNLLEVLNAEAYMLFYRVTNHPVAERLKGIVDEKESKAKAVINEIRRREEAKLAAEEAKKAESLAAAKAAAAALQDIVESSDDKVPDAAPSSDAEDPNGSNLSSPALGKRARPALANGEEWMRAATSLSPEYLPLFNRIQEFITDNVNFSPEFFTYITEEYNRMSSKLSIGRRVKNNKRIKTLLGKGPGGVCPTEDVQGGAEDITGGILDLFHQIACAYKKNGGGENFLLPKMSEMEDEIAVKEEKMEMKDTSVAATPEVVPPCTLDTELIIPADNADCYDGAL